LLLRPLRTAKSTNKASAVTNSPVSAVQRAEAEQLHPRVGSSRIAQADVEVCPAVAGQLRRTRGSARPIPRLDAGRWCRRTGKSWYNGTIDPETGTRSPEPGETRAAPASLHPPAPPRRRTHLRAAAQGHTGARNAKPQPKAAAQSRNAKPQPKATRAKRPSVRLVQPRPLRRGQLQIHRSQALLELRHRRSPDQRDHRKLPTHQPGQHHLVDRRPGLPSH
jgi:hypothetical protein